MPYALLLLPAVCVAGVILAGCAAVPPVPEAPVLPVVSVDHPVYVLAPASYSRYLSGGHQEVLLASEGEEEDLPVYRTTDEARSAMEAQVSAKELPVGLWRVYRLEGSWEEDVVEPAPGKKRMRRPARLLSAEEDGERPLSPPASCPAL